MYVDLVLVHPGSIFIDVKLVIGDRCRIQHNVTLARKLYRGGVPIIGNDVFIGTSATILGDVTMATWYL